MIPSNQRSFLETLAKKLNITDQEGWKTVTHKTLKENGGESLLYVFNNSLGKLFRSVYPEYPIHFSFAHQHFTSLQLLSTVYISIYHWINSDRIQTYRSHSYWKSSSNQKNFMDDLAEKLNITDPNQWYRVTTTVIAKHGGNTLLEKHNGSIKKILESVYPEYPVCTSTNFQGVSTERYRALHSNVDELKNSCTISLGNDKIVS